MPPLLDERSRAPIDDQLVARLGPGAGEVVVELGCGLGFTLLAAADAAPDVLLVGLDGDRDALCAAGARLGAAAGTRSSRHLLVEADLSCPLPLASRSVDRVVCHNVLELLPEPSFVVAEAGRVLRPGGSAVWSATDFESVVVSGGDVELTRRVVRAYAATPDPGAAHCDGQMGRKLAALVGRSGLRRVAVDAHVVLRTELSGVAEVRVRSMVASLRDAGGDLDADELRAWMDGLAAADRAGEFLYAHTTYIVVAEKR